MSDEEIRRFVQQLGLSPADEAIFKRLREEQEAFDRLPGKKELEQKLASQAQTIASN
jgi:hypothetical protein